MSSPINGRAVIKPITLQRRGDALASPQRQLEVLAEAGTALGGSFEQKLAAADCDRLTRTSLDVIQVNVGKVCNQTCSHCHVDAGPERKESMDRPTAQAVIDFLVASRANTLDITGGAPEMNPHFRWLVQQAHSAGKSVIDRCNLTILLAPGFRDLPEFLAQHRVEVIASLPCYLEQNCDAQRGDGTFQKSIQAIQELNRIGYAQAGTGLHLNLVYNPIGNGLPPDQSRLEQTYREQLGNLYSIQFDRLLTITNMPVSRFLDDLCKRDQLQSYMQTLVDHFNPASIDGLMCRSMVSIDWQGYLYDCDFNQMLDMRLGAPGAPMHVSQVAPDQLVGQLIRSANHCFGCTAGAGSGCWGSISANQDPALPPVRTQPCPSKELS